MSQCRHRASGYLVAVDSATQLPPPRSDDTAAAGPPLLIRQTISVRLVCSWPPYLSYVDWRKLWDEFSGQGQGSGVIRLPIRVLRCYLWWLSLTMYFAMLQILGNCSSYIRMCCTRVRHHSLRCLQLYRDTSSWLNQHHYWYFSHYDNGNVTTDFVLV